MIKYFAVFLFSFSAFFSPAQEMKYVRGIVDTLTSPFMFGRGYVNKGDSIASVYIRNEFRKLGVMPFEGHYFQHFSFSVNTFPGKVALEINNKKLEAGRDFLISPASPTIKGNYAVAGLSEVKKIKKHSKKNHTVVLSDKPEKDVTAFIDSLQIREYIPAVLLKKKKLTWSTATDTHNLAFIEVLESVLPQKIKRLKLDVENYFISSYPSQNVIGYLEGDLYPDSFIVFTAHYDHLGMLGKQTYFPGANDNASGIAMLLSLARHYAQAANKPAYSVAFMAFGAEEAGLIGSRYYTEHPLFPLSKIKFLINLDLIGTGEEGITVVNATEFKEYYNALNHLNEEHHYLKQIKSRGKAANSDHYYFTEKGVKAFFIYTMGGIDAYHDIYDKAQTLPLTEFEDVFRLLIAFASGLSP